MTAALFTKSSVSWRCLDLLDDEPIVVRPAGRVDAIPVLQHDAPETLRHECLAPRAQPAGHVRREADVPGLREDALEVTPSLEERDLEERLAVDLEEIERGEDAPPSGRSRERIALLVHLEVRLVAPVVDQHAVDDRAVTPRVGDDRVVELARGVELAPVPAEAGPARVPDTYEGARSHPLRLQDVALRFRALADEAWSLRCQVGSEERRHIPSTSLIVRPLTARTFVLSCPNVRSNGRQRRPQRGAPWPLHPRSPYGLARPKTFPLPHHATCRWHPPPGGCHRACTRRSVRVHARPPWPCRRRRRRRPSRPLAARGGASSVARPPEAFFVGKTRPGPSQGPRSDFAGSRAGARSPAGRTPYRQNRPGSRRCRSDR